MFIRPGRAKPTSTRPAARAASTASIDGALTATTAAKPPAQAFCTISKLARPLTNRPSDDAGRRPVEQQATHHLVDRVVAADVLTDELDRSIGGERRRRVHRSGGGEQTLFGSDPVGHGGQHVWRELGQPGEGRQPFPELNEVGRPAEPARRGRGAQARGRCRCPATGVHRHHVELRGARRAGGAVPDPLHRSVTEGTVGEAEADGQLVVVTGRAHRRGRPGDRRDGSRAAPRR